MAEALVRRDPVMVATAEYAGVKLGLAPTARRWSLRARDPSVLENCLNLPLPRKIGETLGEIACLGPDEWLWRSASAQPLDMGGGQPLSIVDVSERSVGFTLEGEAARCVLNSGCPLDLEKFGIGRTTRTIYEGVEIILHREAQDRWTVDVWRSFAEWLWLSFNTAAANP
jgi:sarcosine oxidase, subunit gamma